MSRIGFAISGKGRLSLAAILHREYLGLSVGHVILDTTADPDLDHLLSTEGIGFTRLVSGTRIEVQEQILRTMGDYDDIQWFLTFDRILAPEIVALRPGSITNYHPALLPAHRGRNGIGQALHSGVRFTGATIHEVSAEVDAGAIVSQAVVPVNPSDSAETLGERVFMAGLPLFLQAAVWYANDRVRTTATHGIVIDGASPASSAWSPGLENQVTTLMSRLQAS